MEKRNLTERGIAACDPAGRGTRYEVFDLQVPGFGLRINHKKKIKVQRSEGALVLALPQGQYILYAPRRGMAAVRWSIGNITGISLAEARQKALALKRDLAAGLDPKDQRERLKKAEHAAKELTFGRAMERYLLSRVDKQRRGTSTRADIERDIVPFWKDRPLRDITKPDVRDRILEIAEGRNRGTLDGKKSKRRGASPRQAQVALSNVQAFFNWAAEIYDLPTIPTGGLKKLIPAIKPRQRVLNDDEILAYWRATERTAPPLKQGYQLLMLTGARYSEIFDADRRELSKKGDLLTIPPERFKSNAEHLIPLTSWAQEIIATAPRFKGCNFILSRDGESTAAVWTNDRRRLARRMERTLKALARVRAEEDARHMTLKPFVLHDVRRTVRTRLSALQVPDEIAELIIGHGRKGLQRIYNLHRAEKEMREALARWGTDLQAIVYPKKLAPLGENIIHYPAKA